MKKLPTVIVLTVPEGSWDAATYECVVRTALILDAAQCHKGGATKTEVALRSLSDSARLVDLEAMAHEPGNEFNPYYAEGVATACRKIAGVD
jgi:hypothetical protein